MLIVIPLALAWLTQAWAARPASGQRVADAMGTTMVPLITATLRTVVASKIPKLGDGLAAVAHVVPFYVLFLVVMAVAGLVLLWHDMVRGLARSVDASTAFIDAINEAQAQLDGARPLRPGVRAPGHLQPRRHGLQGAQRGGPR